MAITKLIADSITSGAIANTPAFLAKRNETQSMAGDTDTKLISTDKVFDTDNSYNTTTGQFTVPSGKGGKYYFFAGFEVANMDDNKDFGVSFKINGSFLDGYSNALGGYFTAKNTAPSASNFSDPAVVVSIIFDLSAGDYVEMWGRQRDGGSEDARNLRFGGYRLIGV